MNRNHLKLSYETKKGAVTAFAGTVIIENHAGVELAIFQGNSGSFTVKLPGQWIKIMPDGSLNISTEIS